MGVGLGQQVNGDLVTEFLVVTVHESKAENVLSWSSWEFEFYRYIEFFVWLDALVLQAESVVDNDGSIDQLELHIHRPSNLSRVLEFASCTEVGSCDSNEFLRLVKACRLIDRLSSIKERFKAEDLTQDAFKAKIAGITAAVSGFLAGSAIITAVLLGHQIAWQPGRNCATIARSASVVVLLAGFTTVLLARSAALHFGIRFFHVVCVDSLDVRIIVFQTVFCGT